jgi:DsbC/DsbD-like thiol-disulfide interchange protein
LRSLCDIKENRWQSSRRHTVIIRHFLTIISGLLLSNALCASVRAEPGASAWVKGAYSSVRLISGIPASDETLRAGIHVRLAPGFKTYWRTPGNSGVPPHVSFAGSVNLASVDMKFPFPSAFDDGVGASFGYHDEVVFPLRVLAQDRSKPVELMVALDYAVCERLCVPAQATAHLTLPAKGTAVALSEPLLQAHEARVPHKQKLGAPGSLTITRLEQTGPHSFTASAVAPGLAALFAEGPPGWYVETAPQGDQTGGARFEINIAEKPKSAQVSEATLLLTLVSGTTAIETEVRLDAVLRNP